MTNVQLTLPFSTSLKLSDNQKVKLISCQAKRLGIAEKEIQELLRACLGTGMVTNGLALVYEYAGCIDEIKSLIHKLLLVTQDLDNYSQSLQQSDPLELLSTAISASIVLVRICFILCQWRKLQQQTRPIMITTIDGVFDLREFLEQISSRLMGVLETFFAKYPREGKLFPVELFTIFTVFSPFYKQPDDVLSFYGNLKISPVSLSVSTDGRVLPPLAHSLFVALKHIFDTEEFIAKQKTNPTIQHTTLRIPFLAKLNKGNGAYLQSEVAYDQDLEVLLQLIRQKGDAFRNNRQFSVLKSYLPQSFLQKDVDSTACYDLRCITREDVYEVTVTKVFPINYQLQSRLRTKSRSLSIEVLEAPESSTPVINKSSGSWNRLSVDSQPESRMSTNTNVSIEQPETEHLFKRTEQGKKLDQKSTKSMQSLSVPKINRAASEDVSFSPEGLVVTPVKPRGRFYSADHIGDSSKTKQTRSPTSIYHISTAFGADISFSNVNSRSPALPAFLRGAFASIEERGWSKFDTASAKIAVWYRLVAPRRKLIRRMNGRQCVQEIIKGLVDRAYNISISRSKRKTALLRHGAIVKIQKSYRDWIRKVHKQHDDLVQQQRKQVAWRYLFLWANSVLASIRIHRYLTNWRYERDLPKPVKMGVILGNYLVELSFHAKVNSPQRLVSGVEVHGKATKRLQMLRVLEHAISIIQKCIKRHVKRMRSRKAMLYHSMATKIAFFVLRGIRRRRQRKEQLIFDSATKIQTFFRGIHIRYQVFQLVSAGLRLSAFCRKRKAYKSLKSQLRRVDRPLTVSLHGLRNIVDNIVHSNTIRFKLSVWWNPLLHIVGKNDFHAVLQSKRPQFLYESPLYKIQRQDGEEPEKQEPKNFNHLLEKNPRLKELSEKSRGSALNPNSSSNLRTSAVLQSPQAGGRHRRTATVAGKQESSSPTKLPSVSPKSGHFGRETLMLVRPKASVSSLREREENEDDDDENELENDDDEVEAEDEDAFEVDKFEASQSSRKSFTETIGLPSLSAKKRSGSPSDNNSTGSQEASSPGKFSVVRETFNFALRLGGNPAQQKTVTPLKAKYSCNFEDLVVKIPGCHGNSVLKFELLDGDRKLGNTFFYLGNEGGMMYWGGEYHKEVSIVHQRRAIQLNAHILSTSADRSTKSGIECPILDFRLIAGAPLRSRCQWGRIIVRGSGPLKRTLQGQDLMSTLTIFDNWRRFYLSLDEFGLFLFENKFSSKPFFFISIKDLKTVNVDCNLPVKANSSGTSKSVIEDIVSVVLTTTLGDEIFMRFPDSGSRVAWFEAFTNAIAFNKKSSNNTKAKSWFGNSWSNLASRVTNLSSLSPVKFRGLSPSAKREEEEEQRRPRVPSKVILDGRSRKPAIFQAPSAHMLTEQQ